jgi:hypothetical protein
MCGASARDFAVLAASRAEKRKGEERGGLGLFIDGRFLAEGARVWALEMDGWEESCRGGVHPEVRDDRWARRVSEEEREDPYRFGFLPGGPWAQIEAGPNCFPWPFFFSLFIFLFYFFLFLIYFIIFAYLFQINSNKFLDYSNIQHNVLNQ